VQGIGRLTFSVSIRSLLLGCMGVHKFSYRAPELQSCHSLMALPPLVLVMKDCFGYAFSLSLFRSTTRSRGRCYHSLGTLSWNKLVWEIQNPAEHHLMRGSRTPKGTKAPYFSLPSAASKPATFSSFASLVYGPPTQGEHTTERDPYSFLSNGTGWGASFLVLLK
jgi:hypothetical protein